MKKETEEMPDELNPDLMLNMTASELLIKVAKGGLISKSWSGSNSLPEESMTNGTGSDSTRLNNIGRNITSLPKPSLPE